MKYITINEASGGVAVVNKPPKKKFKCPYCDLRFERAKLHIHIQNKHEELIPEGFTALRVAFNTINHKTEGHCIICKAVTDWNEDKGRYERLCNKQECHDEYREMAAERNRNKYGTDRLQTDPVYAEYVQRKALEGRKMAGKYKFTDGGEIQYLGTYEKKLLEFMDTVMHCKSEDITAPGPSIEYEFEGKKHLYIPDFYYEPYNLIIEIKDGGNNPNTHPKRIEEEKKNRAKEEAVIAGHMFNYVRVVNNDFEQLVSIMAVIKFQMFYHKYYYPDPVIRVHENDYTPMITLIDKCDFSDIDKINEDSTEPEGALYPVYICLMHSGTALADAIKTVTKTPYSHSSISFDSSLEHMYSFGRKYDNNPLIGCFKRENIRSKFFKDRVVPYSLYMVLCTSKEVQMMKNRLSFFIKNASKFKYDKMGLVLNYMGIDNNPKYKYFCSRFVADILNAGNPNNPYVDKPSLWKPSDFMKMDRIIYITGGKDINEYDQKKTDKIVKDLIKKNEKLSESVILEGYNFGDEYLNDIVEESTKDDT